AVLISASPRPRDLHSFPTRRSSDLLTLLFRFMTPLIEAGHVYLARPPLYKIKWDQRGGDADYVFSDRERDEAIARGMAAGKKDRSEEHTSELQSRENLVCRLLLEKK